MITPEEFPYIKSLYVNDCYAYKDFPIELHDYKPFSHLILTGKNGSGKSTILRAIDTHLLQWRGQGQDDPGLIDPDHQIASYQEMIHYIVNYDKHNHSSLVSYQEKLNAINRIGNFYSGGGGVILSNNSTQTIYSFLKAKRESKVKSVETVTKDENFSKQLIKRDSADIFSTQFKQYLVNKKVAQAFAQLDGNQATIDETDSFFTRITNAFRTFFEDSELSLEFVQENFEFYIALGDGRRITFDVLSEGYSALLSILMDLFMRVDLIRKQVNDYSYNPCGIVLIDEPETHLHLQLQEQVLPLLTGLFPNVQFIAATHSPAVIASIKNTTIFDLTTKETRISEDAVGRSYSDLMTSHFGLDNEYSETADNIIRQVDQAVAEFGNDPARLREVLKPIYETNSDYLSPTLKVKFELLMAKQEAKAVAHS